MYYAVEYWESVEINDFDVRARVGWEQGEHQTLLFGVGHTFAPIYIKYESRPEYEHPIIWANFKSWGGGETKIQAPIDGFHEFRLTRINNFVTAYFNNESILQFQDNYPEKFYGPQFIFGGPHQENSPLFAPLYVDYVTVVPEPSTISAISSVLVLFFFRNKKRKKNLC